MEITGLNKYCPSDASSPKAGQKYNSDTTINMAETFKNAVLNWEEKTKQKINKDLENDREKNIMMSKKQWLALLKKVDSAINIHNKNTYVKVDFPKPNAEDNQLDVIEKADVDLVQKVDNDLITGILLGKKIPN